MGQKSADIQETSFGLDNDAFVGDKDAIAVDADGKPKSQAVSTKELFRFCGKRERKLIICGTIGAILHGAALPIMIIFYGQMTENFVQWNICDELTAVNDCFNNQTAFAADPTYPTDFTETTEYCYSREVTFNGDIIPGTENWGPDYEDGVSRRDLYRSGQGYKITPPPRPPRFGHKTRLHPTPDQLPISKKKYVS
jgi:hypothetical protein